MKKPHKTSLSNFLRNNQKTHLIFDFDYTLFKMVIPWELWHQKIEEELKRLDNKILEDYLKERINLSELQNLYIHKFGESVKDKIIRHNEWFETTFAKRFDPNKELVRLIPQLPGYKKYIWSSNTRKNVYSVLKKNNLFDYFEKVVTRNDVSLLKPYSDGFKLINKMGDSIKSFLFVGDSGSDKKAASMLEMDYFQIDYFNENTSSF